MVSGYSKVRSGTLTWREWGLWYESPPPRGGAWRNGWRRHLAGENEHKWPVSSARCRLRHSARRRPAEKPRKWQDTMSLMKAGRGPRPGWPPRYCGVNTDTILLLHNVMAVGCHLLHILNSGGLWCHGAEQRQAISGHHVRCLISLDTDKSYTDEHQSIITMSYKWTFIICLCNLQTNDKCK